MRAIESMAMEVLNHDELAAILGDLAIETHSNAMTTQSPDWQIAKDVFVSLAENRLFFRHEMICAVDAPTDILYSEMLVRMKVDDQVLLPGRFIPALERLSLMRPFDRFVLGRTLDESADSRPLEAQIAGEFCHRRFPVTQYPQHPQLRQGQILFGGHPAQRRGHRE